MRSLEKLNVQHDQPLWILSTPLAYTARGNLGAFAAILSIAAGIVNVATGAATSEGLL